MMDQQESGNPMEILRMPNVLAMTSLSRTTLWRRVREGTFPRPLRLGGERSRAVGWRRGEVEEWIRKLPAA